VPCGRGRTQAGVGSSDPPRSDPGCLDAIRRPGLLSIRGAPDAPKKWLDAVPVVRGEARATPSAPKDWEPRRGVHPVGFLATGSECFRNKRRAEPVFSGRLQPLESGAAPDVRLGRTLTSRMGRGMFFDK